MTPALRFLCDHGHVRLRVNLAGFDTVGHPLFDRRLLALKQYVEQEPLTVYEAFVLLNEWVAVLRYSAEAGTIDRLPAERSRNIMKTWVDQLERALREQVGGHPTRLMTTGEDNVGAGGRA